MVGTVTSYSSGTLVMSITSTGGSCGNSSSSSSPSNCARWLISTIPSTVLVNNNTSSTMFSVTEDTSYHTNISGIKVAAGTGTVDGIDFNYASGGQAILVHDCWIEQPSSPGDSIHFSTDRGVVWNCSFDSTPFSMAPLAIHVKSSSSPPVGSPLANSWITASTMGMADTTGQNNIYIESSDFHAYLNAFDNDDNGRLVVRYSLMNNAAFGTHGADGSPYGERHFEFYNNVGVFNGYSNGTTFNMNWWFFIRGGTFAVHDNTLPAINSQDYPNVPDFSMTVMNLQRNIGNNACWGAGTSGGADYHAPRQAGFGYVTGNGTANYPPDGCTNCTDDAVTYVGDSEPIYIWNNSRSPMNVRISDYVPNQCTSPDTSANYIISGRDYFNGSTAKPGYTPYTYPHPLEQGQGGDPPSPPTNLQAISQ